MPPLGPKQCIFEWYAPSIQKTKCKVVHSESKFSMLSPPSHAIPLSFQKATIFTELLYILPDISLYSQGYLFMFFIYVYAYINYLFVVIFQATGPGT